jgi:hypothetical protein
MEEFLLEGREQRLVLARIGRASAMASPHKLIICIYIYTPAGARGWESG